MNTVVAELVVAVRQTLTVECTDISERAFRDLSMYSSLKKQQTNKNYYFSNEATIR